MNYSYAIERTAAQAVFESSPRERRLLRVAIEAIAAAPSHAPDLIERDAGGRELLTRFFGPFALTYWIDHAVPEVRILPVYRD
ncbi:MAG: hypothetical protein RIQ93_260 [Verrucomicrobiota bacterium]